jgi:hypothetical protein
MPQRSLAWRPARPTVFLRSFGEFPCQTILSMRYRFMKP